MLSGASGFPGHMGTMLGHLVEIGPSPLLKEGWGGSYKILFGGSGFLYICVV